MSASSVLRLLVATGLAYAVHLGAPASSYG